MNRPTLPLLTLLLVACVDGQRYQPLEVEIELELICWLWVDGRYVHDCDCSGVWEDGEMSGCSGSTG